jgi:UDP-N-acetylglucosamine 2-epimerase (non-hydrolysing)
MPSITVLLPAYNEETCILGVPCVTLRENTERPETVEVGANILAGMSAIEILNLDKRRRRWLVRCGMPISARLRLSGKNY